MARQIQLYMLPGDQAAFLHFAQAHDDVLVTLRDTDSPKIRPIDDLKDQSGNVLCLWNVRILPRLERKWIAEPGYYRIDCLRTPTLEFSPSFQASWEGKPGLGQGRLFGDFDSYLKKPKSFGRWYDSLVRWIRKNYKKSPAKFGGYVAPSAYEFYRNGSYLLPGLLPPKTKEWISAINAQHSEPTKLKDDC